MEIAQSLASISGCFKLLLILTSAMFAIAQYYDTRQQKMITQYKDDLWKHELVNADDIIAVKAVKEEFDRLTNIKAEVTQSIIIALWILLFIYSFLLMAILMDPYWFDGLRIPYPPKHFLILSISSVYLFLMSCWLTLNLIKMRRQLKIFRNDIEVFKKMCEAIKSALGNS